MAPLSITVSKVVRGDAAAAYAGWLQHVWREGGGLPGPAPRVVVSGDPTTGQGCARKVSGLREEISASVYPSSVSYSVVAGPFPVYSHSATVFFEPVAETTTVEGGGGGGSSKVTSEKHTTRVRWTVELEPWPLCTWLVRRLVLWSFNGMLNHLEKVLADNTVVKEVGGDE